MQLDFELFHTHCGTYLHLPIEEIDHVQVFAKAYAFINSNGETNFRVMIDSKLNSDTLYHSMVSNPTEEIITCELDKLKQLKYYKNIQKLCLDDTSSKQMELIEQLFLKDNTNLKLSIEECCVCLDSTNTKLKCKHAICLSCEAQLKMANCPLCRSHYCRLDCECNGDHDE